MVTRDELLKDLKKEKKSLENKIKYRTFYNCRGKVFKKFLTWVRGVNIALPFVVTSAVCLYGFNAKKNPPFTRDILQNQVIVETIDTSCDLHVEYESSDYNYDDKKIEYSTGWFINKDGIYERTITSYKVDDSVDLNDTDYIFSLNKEELEKIVKIKNVETVKKNTLSAEDDIYFDECIMVTNYKKKDEVKEHMETQDENIIHSLFYILMVCGFGFELTSGLNEVERKLFKKTFDIYLKEKADTIHDITSDDIVNYQKILAVKEENLRLLTNENNNQNSLKLRKNNGDSHE